MLPFAGISDDLPEGHPASRITDDSYFLDCHSASFAHNVYK